MMQKITWIFTPALVLGLTACPSSSTGETESNGTSTTTTTETTETTADMTTTEGTTTTTTTEGTTVAPTTESPTTESPTTAAPTTDEQTTDETTEGEQLSCTLYCQTYGQACADFSEYAGSPQVCVEQCSQWPAGSLDDVDGDTLGCRVYHATVASMGDAATHCPHAGPSGAGVCVAAEAPQCANYCSTYFKNCTDDLNVYANEEDCLNQCAGWYPGSKDDVEGDTVGCREYHAGAALADPATHCPHAAPGGGGVCVI